MVASSKTNRFLTNNNLTVEIHEEVDLIVSHPSTLGMNVIINNSHLGLIYKDDIFKDLSVGDKIKGYVKKIREGNKIDITLQKMGYRNIEPSAKELLKLISIHNGKLRITDKSSPEEIRSIDQMSKKSFKKHGSNPRPTYSISTYSGNAKRFNGSENFYDSTSSKALVRCDRISTKIKITDKSKATPRR